LNIIAATNSHNWGSKDLPRWFSSQETQQLPGTTLGVDGGSEDWNIGGFNSIEFHRKVKRNESSQFQDGHWTTYRCESNPWYPSKHENSWDSWMFFSLKYGFLNVLDSFWHFLTHEKPKNIDVLLGLPIFIHRCFYFPNLEYKQIIYT
jgi:hypothetical protein